MTGSTRVLGVFGHPVSHSLSPVMHNAAIKALDIDFVYMPFHVLPENLEKAVDGIRALDIAGVNVTIPHKERIIEFLDEISENARRIGSVNTVVNDHGRLRGESTDGAGFMRSAEAALGKISGKVVILGAGGSAKAVAYALADAGCEVVIANRTFDRAAELAEALRSAFGAEKCRAVEICGDDFERELGEAGLLVNSTSVGMHPHSDGIPISPDLIRPGMKVYDLVYNPLETRLVKEARANGAEAMTGLGMLVHQGAVSFEMWTGKSAPVDIMARSVEHIMSSEL